MTIDTAVIIAGGEGVRLRPLTLHTPKALIDINGKTLTEHVLDILAKYKVGNVVLGLGYLAGKVRDYFGDGSRFNFNISYTVEEKPMGTAGPLILLPKFDSTFFMINGDNLFDLDLSDMYAFHKKNNATATIALTSVEDTSQFGVVAMDGCKILKFVEKPKFEEAPSNLISSGYYILEPEICDMVKGKSFAMLEKDVFPKLASEGKLFGYKCDGLWFDTGTFERLESIRAYWKGV
ncbi:MAG: nucleotidyltransferase family protein [archaeon]